VSGFRILVADDLPVWRVAVRHLLEARPEWQVIEACDGREAVEKATELNPDIVLLDIGMPILNGLEAAEKIRAATPSSKLIFLTMNGDGELKTAALATGAKAYLLKANAGRELLPTIAAALDGQQG
jgi:DNA-binding NarL/FixJ family response regulator